MKTFKEWLEEKGIGLSDFSAKSDQEKGQLYKEFNQYFSLEVKSALSGFAKAGDIPSVEGLLKAEDLGEEIKKTQTYKDLETLVDEAKEAARNANQGETSGNPGLGKATKELAGVKDTLKAIATRSKNEEVVVKALTLRSSVATNTIGLDLPGVGQLGVKVRSFYEFLSKQVIPLPADHAGTIRYRDWDESTTVRSAAAVAEGAAFPESTAKWKGYTLPIEKIGDTLPVTEEFFEDEATIAAELDMFLRTNVLNKVDLDLIQGDGISPNIKSIDSEAPDFSAAASGISDANIFDLAVKVQEDIETNRGSKYQTDFILMNIADYNKLVLKKDANDNYLFDANFLANMPWQIVVDNNVPANEMYMGDSRFMRVYEMPGVAISQGMVGTQFTEDEMTLKARKRLAFLIRNVDKTGFRHVASISAALTTLAT